MTKFLNFQINLNLENRKNLLFENIRLNHLIPSEI